MKVRKKILSGFLAIAIILCSILPANITLAKVKGTVAAGGKVAYRLYVSPKGSDNGKGTKKSPFKTIEQAKKAVRKLPKTKGDIVVEIAKGFYSLNDTIVFDEKDSGTDKCTIYYEAAKGAKPVISGGKLLNSKWEEATEVNWLRTGLKAYKTTLNRNDKLRAIYVNGKRASMTRKKASPKKAVGNYRVTKGQADWAWVSSTGPISTGSVFLSSFIPADTRNPQNIELETATTWVTTTVCAKSTEATAEGTQVNFQMPYAAIAQNSGWYTNYNPTASNDVYNVYEWLGKEGEFYFDQAASTLYYIPREGENMSTAQVVIPKLEKLIDIRGSVAKTKYAKYITLKGLCFAHTDWNLYGLDGSHGYATVQAATILTKFADGILHNDMYRSYDIPPAAITVNTAKYIRILDGEIKLTGNIGVHLENDVSDCEVTGNYIGQTGGGGIVVGHPQHVYENDTKEHQVASRFAGPDKEKFAYGTEAAPFNIKLDNNYLLENCYFFPGNAPITSFYTKNLQVLHNFVYKCPYSGLSIGWGWCNFDGTDKSQLPGIPNTTSRNNHINYNRVEEICSKLQDAGGIYSLGQQGNDDWTESSEMNGNYINCKRMKQKPDGSRKVNGFHPDEGSAYIKFDSNVVTNTIQNVYEMNEWMRKHDLIVTNGFSNSSRSETSAPNCKLQQYVNPNYVWPIEGYKVVLNSGLEDKYVSMVGKEVIPDTDYELASNVRVSGGTTIPRRGLLSAKDEVWLAPLGTNEFTKSSTMTKATGNKKSIIAPETAGEYKLYIKYANGTVSDSSTFTLYVN